MDDIANEFGNGDNIARKNLGFVDRFGLFEVAFGPMGHRVFRHTHRIDNFTIANKAFGILHVSDGLCLCFLDCAARSAFVEKCQAQQQEGPDRGNNAENWMEQKYHDQI